MYKGTLILLSCAAAALAQTAPKVFLDNDEIRVTESIAQPHLKQKMHDHKNNRVMIYRVAGAERFEFADGRSPVVLKFTKNEVKWSPPDTMHSPEIVTDEPVPVVQIELKKPRSGRKITTGLDPLQIDPKHYKLEFENDQVRVVRVKFGPRESAPLHEHQLDRVVFYLTDAEIRVTNAEGKAEITPRKAGEVVYGKAAKHEELNTTGKAVEILMTELK
ncbi:hypothetical protein [Bryobacter aggregatus]|uniref:hypothetical protein n=1 Tax=Bryobacter aggregatus TaxID=360054 RepID=UPI0004E1BBAD|nr:hypothetical protein [Bryobacter aggregatus]